MRTRPPAVAGMFYPGSVKELNAMLHSLLASAADGVTVQQPRPRALIVPHAGYIYSGAIAARAYALVRDQHYSRVALLGPAHRVALRGLALPTVEAFATPLGSVPLATDVIEKLSDFPGVSLRDDAHAEEHSLEVQLPFLQTVFSETRADAPLWTLLPVVVGYTAPETVAAFLKEVVDADTLVIISTDLSHFRNYQDARKCDADTVRAIVNLRSDIEGEQACGAYPLNGFARYAQAQHWSVHMLAQCNSGDTAGDKQRVVGYASFSVH